MGLGRMIIELCARSWGELDEDEREVFAEWLKTAAPHDLFLLVRHAMKHRKTSSVKAIKAVTSDD